MRRLAVPIAISAGAIGVFAGGAVLAAQVEALKAYAVSVGPGVAVGVGLAMAVALLTTGGPR